MTNTRAKERMTTMRADKGAWRVASVGALVALSLTACGQGVSDAKDKAASSGGAKASAVSLTNCGEKVEQKETPKRIVTLTPGLSDLAKRLGVGDKVVGEAQNPSNKLTPGLAKDAQVLSTGMPPAREKLLSAQPDLVLSPTGYEFSAEQGFATKDQLKKAGAAAYVSTGGCMMRRSSSEVTDLLTDIDNLGKLTGETAGAKKLREQAQRELDSVDQAVKGKKKPTVVQVYIEGGKLSAIGAGVEHDIIKRAGGENLFKPSDPQFKEFFSADITKETLLQKNPDVIVFAGPDEKARAASRDYLKKNFAGLKAVKGNRLIELDSDKVMPGVWGNIESVKTVAKGLHPDAKI